MSECTKCFMMRLDFIKIEECKAEFDELETYLHAYDKEWEYDQSYEKGTIFFRWISSNAEDVDFSFSDWLEKITKRYPQCGIFAVLENFMSQTGYDTELYIKYKDEQTLNFSYYDDDYEYASLYERNKRYQQDVESQYQQQLLFYYAHTYYLLTRSELQHSTFLEEGNYVCYSDEELLKKAEEDINYHYGNFNFVINKKCIINQKQAIQLRKQHICNNIHLLIERDQFKEWLQDYHYEMDEDEVLLDLIKKEMKKDKKRTLQFWTMLIKKVRGLSNLHQIFDEAVYDPFYYLMHYYMSDLVTIMNHDDMIRYFFFQCKNHAGLQNMFLCQLIKKGYEDIYHHIQEVGIQAYEENEDCDYDDRLNSYLYTCVELIHDKKIKFTKRDFMAIIKNIEYLSDKIFLNDCFKNQMFLATCKRFGCYIFELNGSGYCDYERLLHECAEAQPLQIVYEKENAYDPNAIRVETLQGLKIGYVPKEINKELQGIMNYRCTLVRMYSSKKNHFIRVMITNLD